MMAHGNEIASCRYAPYGLQFLIEMIDHILYDPLPQITENRQFVYAFDHIFLTYIQTIEVQCLFYPICKRCKYKVIYCEHMGPSLRVT